jgi:hypothetical protein
VWVCGRERAGEEAVFKKMKSMRTCRLRTCGLEL